MQLRLIRGFGLITKTLHRVNILCYIRQPSRIIRAKCQGAAAKNWLAAREADLLPVGYFREAVDDIDTRQRPHEFGEGGPDGLSRAFVVTMIGSFTALAASAQPRPVVRKGHAISTA